MVDSVLEWAKRQHDEWQREISLLESGIKSTFEIREGHKVETTMETLAARTDQLSELGKLVERHEAQSAKGPKGAAPPT
jgi:hypothetical protein